MLRQELIFRLLILCLDGLGPVASDLKATICLDLVSIIFGDGTELKIAAKFGGKTS